MAAPVATRADRVSAAARMVGAPRGFGAFHPPGSAAPRTGGAAAPRGITQHQAAPPKPMVQHQARDQAQHAARAVSQHAARAGAPRPAAPAPAKQTGYDPLREAETGKYQNLNTLAQGIVNEGDKPITQAYAQRTGEITGAEGTALQRQAGVAQTEQQQLAGLQAGQEGSAKTAQNVAAEAAAAAQQEVKQSGQAAQMSAGGTATPFPGQGTALQETGALGGAAGQYAASMGLSGANQMSALRAAAAQRQGEGATRLQTDYAGAQQASGAKESEALEKEFPGGAKSLGVTLGQQRVTDKLTMAKMIQEGAKGLAESSKPAREAEKNRDVLAATREKNQNTLSLGKEKNAVTIKGDEIKARNTLEKEGIKNAGAIAKEQVKAKYELEVANKKAGKATSAEEHKMSDEMSTAYRTIVDDFNSGIPLKEIREGFTKGSLEVKSGGKTVKEKYPTIHNQLLVQAAVELAYYHRVNATTAKQLAQQGMATPVIENGEISFG